MKTSTPQFRWIKSIASAAALIIASSAFAISTSGTVSATVTAGAAPPQYDQSHLYIQFSAGIAEILKMTDAKVEGSVLIAYIDTSPIAYNPSASEIIMLRDRGVPSEVIAAMLKHGSELRAQAMAAMPPQSAQPYPTQPYANVAPQYGQTSDYSYSSPMDYSDFGYGYPPSAYSYGSFGFPSYSPWFGFWPSFYFGNPFFFSRPFFPFPRFGFRNRFPITHFPTFPRFPGFKGGKFGTFPPRGGGFRAVGGGHSMAFGHVSGGMGSFGGGFHAGGGSGFHGGGGFVGRGGGGFGGHGGGGFGGHGGSRGR